MKLGELSPQRIVVYVLLLGLIPVLGVAMHYFKQSGALEQIESTWESVQSAALLQERRQAQNNIVRNFYREADHFYIDKHIESLTFLEPEVESLQKIASNKNIGQTEAITKRLELLTGPGNSLQFTEGVVQTYPYFQETMESLTHSVEVDVNDLQKILAAIEGVEIGSHAPGPNRPQLIITEFKLDKKKIRENNEVFVLQLKFLKREYL